MQYKLLPPRYALCAVTDWLAFNWRGVMCVCMSLCGWANVGVRVGVFVWGVYAILFASVVFYEDEVSIRCFC